MILKVLVGLAALVVLVVGVVAVVVALQPSEFRITRRATIAAPVAAVFAQVNDFHNWAGWSTVGEARPVGQEYVRGGAGWNGRRLRVGREQHGR